MNKKNKNKKVRPMTKSQIIKTLVDRTEMKKQSVVTVINELMDLAYSQAKNGFMIPGLGKLVIRDRKARWGRNPATGEKIRIKAKRVLKFRLSKSAKDAVLGKKK